MTEISMDRPVAKSSSQGIENKPALKSTEKDSEPSEFKAMFDKGVSNQNKDINDAQATKKTQEVKEYEEAKGQNPETEATDESSPTVEKTSEASLVSQLAAMMKGSTDPKGLALANGVDVETNPGRSNLIEKLGESNPNNVYDTDVWQNKSVKEIMAEIKINSINEKAATGITEEVLETGTQGSQKTNNSGGLKIEKANENAFKIPSELEIVENVETLNSLGLKSENANANAFNIKDSNANGSKIENANANAFNTHDAIPNGSKIENANANAFKVEGPNAGSETDDIKTDNLGEVKSLDILKDGQLGSNSMASGVEKTGSLSNQQEVLKAEAYTQIGKEIITKLEQKGPMEFTMQLKPEDLGAIDIKLKISDGKLVIDIMAASSKTQTMLTNQVDKLVSNLGLSNVKIENINVTTLGQGITEQQYVMNGGMGFFQRRNQEQTGRQGWNHSSQRVTKADTIREAIQTSNIRNTNNKMDYAV